MLVGGLVLETAIATTLLARVLPHQLDRWANIVVAIIQSAAVASSLPAPLYANVFYRVFAAIEIATALFIILVRMDLASPREGARRTSEKNS